MINLNLLRTFVKVAELGSFTQASKYLNQPKSRVSRAISRLEEDLGIDLIRRTTRQTVLTSSGQEFFERTKSLINQLDEQINEFTEDDNEVRGLLRVTAPEDMGQGFVSAIAQTYMKKYPKVQLETIITNDFLDLTKENIDVAFRAGKLKSSSLIQRQLGIAKIIFVASKEYIKKHGKPKNSKEFLEHNFLSFKHIENSDLFVSTKTNKRLEVKPHFRADSFPLLMKLVLNGEGIAPIPDFYCREHLKNGKILQVLPEYEGNESIVHVLYPPTKLMPLRLRYFIDITTQEISKYL